MYERARCGRTCTLLTEAPQRRIEQCTNGHLLCSEAGDGDGTSCASRVRAVRGPKCPVCRHGLPSTAIRALCAEQTIAALPSSCHHCSSSMLRGSLRAHEEVCPRMHVLCAAEDGGCRWTGPRAEQDAHEATCVWGRAENPRPVFGAFGACRMKWTSAIRVAGVERDVYERDSGVESFAHQLGKEAQRAPAGYTSERRNFGRPSHGLAVTKSDWRTC